MPQKNNNLKKNRSNGAIEYVGYCKVAQKLFVFQTFNELVFFVVHLCFFFNLVHTNKIFVVSDTKNGENVKEKPLFYEL